MKIFKIAAILALLALPSAITSIAIAQGPAADAAVSVQTPLTPAETANSKVVVVPPAASSGGIIQLSAFGWLQPYADSLVQLLIAAGFTWFGKSRYSAYLDKDARDALETFVKNRASSLIADGAVRLQGKAIHVDSSFLARAANEGATAIPDALKRFGLTADVVSQKIIDAIPQTSAGAAIVAAAHTDDNSIPQSIERPVGSAPSAGFAPPVSGAAS